MDAETRLVQRTFLSWASADRRLKTSLLERMAPHLTISARLDIQWWEMSHLIPGEEWDATIKSRLSEADLGIHLVSASFLASTYITRHELGPFFGPNASKPTVPIGLSKVSLDSERVQLHGVDKRQVFLLRGKFFSELTTPRDKDEFAREAAAAVEDRVLGRLRWGAL